MDKKIKGLDPQSLLERMKHRSFLTISRLVAKYYLRKPELSELIFTKYPSFKGFLVGIINEISYMLNWTSAIGPKIIAFEVTNHCNLRCAICPVNTKMKREKGFLSFDLYKKVITENPQVESIMLHHWGEPLLHPEIFDMVRFAHERGIKTSFYTNGTLLAEKNIDQILDSKLDKITISLDGWDEIYNEIRGVEYKSIEEKVLNIIEKRTLANSNLKIEVSMVILKDTEELVDLFKERWSRLVESVTSQPMLTYSEGQRSKKCRELWRGNLVVLWDGKVVPCCVDYEGTQILGNAYKEELKKIWNGARMKSLRRAHIKGTFRGICSRCSEYQTKRVSQRFE